MFNLQGYWNRIFENNCHIPPARKFVVLFLMNVLRCHFDLAGRFWELNNYFTPVIQFPPRSLHFYSFFFCFCETNRRISIEQRKPYRVHRGARTPGDTARFSFFLSFFSTLKLKEPTHGRPNAIPWDHLASTKSEVRRSRPERVKLLQAFGGDSHSVFNRFAVATWQL